MPTLTSMQIPPPTSWDEFEDVTLSALRLRWESPDLQRHGRSGQSQAGVDIYGEDNLCRLVGVQCKVVSEGSLPLAAVSQEVLKAESFEPRLDLYYVATTAPRDATIQREVRLLSKARTSQGKFPVGILFWEDIASDLAKDPREFKKHFPNLALDMGGVLDVGQKVNPPAKTMFVLPVDSDTWWHLGSRGGLPAMQIVATFRVTNVSDWPVHIHTALLKTPAWTANHVLMSWPEGHRASIFPIPPRATVVVMCDFWVQPPTLTPGTPLTSDIALVDQFGNEHWCPGIVFRSSGQVTKPAASAGASNTELGTRERRVIDIITKRYLETAVPVPGRAVRVELRNFGREEVDHVLDTCIPQWLRRGRDRPNDLYSPTLAGLLASQNSGRVSEFIQQLLAYLKRMVETDPSFSAFTSEDLKRSLGINPAPDVPFMEAVIKASRLSNGGGGNPLALFSWNVPEDIEDIIACEGVNGLLELRMQVLP